MFKVTSFDQGFCCGYSHNFVDHTTFFLDICKGIPVPASLVIYQSSMVYPKKP